jgi:hypothetical protein
MRIRIQLFISMLIQIRTGTQGVKLMRIHTDPDADPSQTLSHKS